VNIAKFAQAIAVVAASALFVKQSTAGSCYTPPEDFAGTHYCGENNEVYALGLVPPDAAENALYVYAQGCGVHYSLVWAQGIDQFGTHIGACTAALFDVSCGTVATSQTGCSRAVEMDIEAEWE